MADSWWRRDAQTIWQAAVDAVKPRELLRRAFAEPYLNGMLADARRILVVGCGKAGAAMAAATEDALEHLPPSIQGIVNVPAGTVRPLQHIRLHAARPAGMNQPTAEGVAGTRQILDLLRSAEPTDIAVCLISGGGSALMPAPVDGITLEDKQAVTKLLHACGATINEMNCVRKHLSAVKGGRLAQAFRGRALFSLIISDVIGDPLDVIASGPTAADPTTFADALDVLKKFQLTDRVPAPVLNYLEAGVHGDVAETPKEMPHYVHNRIIGSNAVALQAAARAAEQLQIYDVLTLGSCIEGETRHAAVTLGGILRGTARGPHAWCVLSGGETTVTLAPNPGRGGRNQEFALAALDYLGPLSLREWLVLSGGTDGEDGPTDAAGAVADNETWQKCHALGLNPRAYLQQNDAYSFFEKVGGLLKPGLTETNVMDVRVMLAGWTLR